MRLYIYAIIHQCLAKQHVAYAPSRWSMTCLSHDSQQDHLELSDGLSSTYRPYLRSGFDKTVADRGPASMRPSTGILIGVVVVTALSRPPLEIVNLVAFLNGDGVEG